MVAMVVAGCSPSVDMIPGCKLSSPSTVLTIGDSLTRGKGASDDMGYPEQLQKLLIAAGRTGITVENLGVNGETSDKLVARTAAALLEHKPSAVFITTGGNDFIRRKSNADTGRSLREIVELVRAADAMPIVFGIPGLSVSAAMGHPEQHVLFGKLKTESKVHVIDGTVSEILGRDDLKSDHIHPNDAGYAVMAQAAFEVLKRCR
jgi:acyl-CoA thioesterase I